jgi:putative DNA primase/helicase
MKDFSTVGATEATQRRGVTAADIAHTLGAARREGREWRCRCPLHGGRSLTLRDGEGGCVLVTCWGGCDRLDVLTELRRLKLLDGGAPDDRPTTTRPEQNSSLDDERTIRALAIWREARPVQKTIVEVYQRSRGIAFEAWPEALRFHPSCCRPRDSAGGRVSPLPAMVALVEHVERGPVASHATYLRPDGTGKADIPKREQKACFGPIAGGAVRLGTAQPDQWLAIGEGIETTLSVMQACALPGWAALSANGIRNLILPREASMVLICADNDASGTGQGAARDAADRFLCEGRRVRVAMPPKVGGDFNDVLSSVAPADLEGEARDVA